jgi:D-beta-D-heptose 7-phosphate kinase / D-beta-D-heptose 1-phosphate adenosyltransferase
MTPPAPLVVVGDSLLDRDLTGHSERTCPDSADAPVVDVESVATRPGGAALAALMSAADGVPTTLVTPVADDAEGRELCDRLEAAGVRVVALGHQGGTRVKARVLADGRTVARLDSGGPAHPVGPVAERLSAALEGAGGVLLSCYGGGVSHHPEVREVLASWLRRGGPLVWDPHPRGAEPLPGCTLLTPNLPEAVARTAGGRTHADSGGRNGEARLPGGELTGRGEHSGPREPTGGEPTGGELSGGGPNGDEERKGDGRSNPAELRRLGQNGGGPSDGRAQLGAGVRSGPRELNGGAPNGGGEHTARALADRLRSEWSAHSVAVTAGADGAWLATGHGVHHVPCSATATGDTCGAGDRFAAAAGAALAEGADALEATRRAVEAASTFVAAGGVVSLRPDAPTGRPAHSNGRTGPAVGPRTSLQSQSRATVVATGGCFDVFHAGHLQLLDQARRLGDRLVVLVNSDASVGRLKGPGRPVHRVEDRVRVLRALTCVDSVVVFDEDDPREALRRIRPDVWVKGGDYTAAQLPEAPLVRSWGGRVVILPTLSGRSTTAVLQSLDGGPL